MRVARDRDGRAGVAVRQPLGDRAPAIGHAGARRHQDRDDDADRRADDRRPRRARHAPRPPPAAPVAPAAAPAADPNVSQPWAVVSAYYGDIESGDYAGAWAALLDSGMTTGQTYQQFVDGFSCTGAQA